MNSDNLGVVSPAAAWCGISAGRGLKVLFGGRVKGATFVSSAGLGNGGAVGINVGSIPGGGRYYLALLPGVMELW